MINRLPDSGVTRGLKEPLKFFLVYLPLGSHLGTHLFPGRTSGDSGSTPCNVLPTGSWPPWTWGYDPRNRRWSSADGRRRTPSTLGALSDPIPTTTPTPSPTLTREESESIPTGQDSDRPIN